ncbi:isocitrate lyase/PEP mutase family protein [Demequina litorisediminis]|uniref:Phosphonomutase n=1 Tax=Demequina litorisediminis TaxID=1849022 RepID=A0ABQ6IDZ1_9MICO|nr:isocitrate lyase/phosphoenolpyruvate mutase family protein [Demequina litorisediminis]GMA36040.1 phosphonomutase [Demequina litorisediminis]
MTSNSTANAADFRALHHQTRPLALPNAWDVGSAIIAEHCGASAIATTSAGIAWSRGRSDGEGLDRDGLIDAIRAIAAAVSVPVTADIEGGHARDGAGVYDTVAAVIDAGAVGINIEDGDRDPVETAARIAQARKAADAAGIGLFVNARTDVFLRGLVPEDGLLAETVARAERYADAGADGVFVPGLADMGLITEPAPAVPLPLNIMVADGSPTIAEPWRRGGRARQPGLLGGSGRVRGCPSGRHRAWSSRAPTPQSGTAPTTPG